MAFVFEWIGANAGAIREAKGFSQQRVATSANLTLRHYQNVERGKVDPRASTVHRIAHALKVPDGALFQKPPPRPRRKPGRPRKDPR